MGPQQNPAMRVVIYVALIPSAYLLTADLIDMAAVAFFRAKRAAIEFAVPGRHAATASAI